MHGDMDRFKFPFVEIIICQRSIFERDLFLNITELCGIFEIIQKWSNDKYKFNPELLFSMLTLTDTLLLKVCLLEHDSASLYDNELSCTTPITYHRMHLTCFSFMYYMS
jgi:hypothetical protein